MIKQSDEYETPQWLFDELNKEFNFTIDLCATESNSKCGLNYCFNFLYATAKTLYVFVLGDFKSAFMNPPYSNPFPFVKQAIALNRCVKKSTIVCLLECDTSTKTWGLIWDYEKQQPMPGMEIRFLPKRLKYELNGVPQGPANFPSVIVVMRSRL